MRIGRRAGLAVVTLAAAGCISIVSGGDEEVRRSETYAASYDETWRAALQSFSELELPIATLEKESGVIATDWILVADPDERMDCPEDPRSAEMRFNLLVEETTGGTRITITTGARARDDEGTLQRCVSTGALERSIHRRVARRVAD